MPSREPPWGFRVGQPRMLTWRAFSILCWLLLCRASALCSKHLLEMKNPCWMPAGRQLIHHVLLILLSAVSSSGLLPALDATFWGFAVQLPSCSFALHPAGKSHGRFEMLISEDRPLPRMLVVPSCCGQTAGAVDMRCGASISIEAFCISIVAFNDYVDSLHESETRAGKIPSQFL